MWTSHVKGPEDTVPGKMERKSEPRREIDKRYHEKEVGGVEREMRGSAVRDKIEEELGRQEGRAGSRG